MQGHEERVTHAGPASRHTAAPTEEGPQGATRIMYENVMQTRILRGVHRFATFGHE